MKLQVSNKLQREDSFRHGVSQDQGRSQSPSVLKLGGSTAVTIAHIEKRQKAYNKTQQLTKLFKTLSTNVMPQKDHMDLKENMLKQWDSQVETTYPN